jgi:hypothetical protein
VCWLSAGVPNWLTLVVACYHNAWLWLVGFDVGDVAERWRLVVAVGETTATGFPKTYTALADTTFGY